MAKIDRAAKWNEYMELQFLKCLLAIGPEPKEYWIMVRGYQSPWAYYRERQEYYDACVRFLYPLMNYTPCKKESREKHAIVQRQHTLRIMYRRWYMDQEKNGG